MSELIDHAYANLVSRIGESRAENIRQYILTKNIPEMFSCIHKGFPSAVNYFEAVSGVRVATFRPSAVEKAIQHYVGPEVWTAYLDSEAARAKAASRRYRDDRLKRKIYRGGVTELDILQTYVKQGWQYEEIKVGAAPALLLKKEGVSFKVREKDSCDWLREQLQPFQEPVEEVSEEVKKLFTLKKG
jgi:hypothetical protein